LVGSYLFFTAAKPADRDRKRRERSLRVRRRATKANGRPQRKTEGSPLRIETNHAGRSFVLGRSTKLKKGRPTQIAVRICGSVPCDATGATAIVFENDGRKRCHTLGMINDHCDRLVRQVPLKGGLPVIVLPSAQASFRSLDRRVAEREPDLLGGYRSI
jgi:hypothetical protein